MGRKLSREEQKSFLKEHRSTLKTVEGQNGGPDNGEGHEFQDPKSLLKAVDSKKESAEGEGQEFQDPKSLLKAVDSKKTSAEGEVKSKDFKAGLRKVTKSRKASTEGKMKQQVGKAMKL